jgi:hypothetical protein
VPPGGAAESLVRVVEGVRGSVPTRMELTIRLDYGAIVPWVTSDTGGVSAMASPDALDERPSRSTPIGLSLGRAPRPLPTREKVSLPVLSTFVRAADLWPMEGDG